jgi:hypothetical protein
MASTTRDTKKKMRVVTVALSSAAVIMLALVLIFPGAIALVLEGINREDSTSIQESALVPENTGPQSPEAAASTTYLPTPAAHQEVEGSSSPEHVEVGVQSPEVTVGNSALISEQHANFINQRLGVDVRDRNSLEEHYQRIFDEYGVTVGQIETSIVNELNDILALVEQAKNSAVSEYESRAIQAILDGALTSGKIENFIGFHAFPAQHVARMAFYTFNNGAFPLDLESIHYNDTSNYNSYWGSHFSIHVNTVYLRDFQNFEVIFVQPIDWATNDGKKVNLMVDLNLGGDIFQAFLYAGEELQLLDIAR